MSNCLIVLETLIQRIGEVKRVQHSFALKLAHDHALDIIQN